MSPSGTHDARVAPAAGSPAQVTAVVVCKSSVFHAGLMHILSGTRFVVFGEALDDRSPLPSLPEDAPVVFIIDAKAYADRTAEVIARHNVSCSRWKSLAV